MPRRNLPRLPAQSGRGEPGAAGQQGLRPSLAARGYFLACLARPDADLTVGSGPGASTPARLLAREVPGNVAKAGARGGSR